MLRIKFAALIIASLFSFGCAKKIQTTKPTESYVPKEYKPELSSIAIPVDIDIAKIQALVNKNVAGLLYEDNDLNNNGGDNLMLKVSKHSDIQISAQGDQIIYRVPLKVWLKGGFKKEALGVALAHYEETDFAIAITLSTKIALNTAWGINTTTEIKSHEWIEKPNLKWGPFEIPLNTVVDVLIKSQKDKVGPLIDEQIKSAINLKKYVNDAWTTIQQPITVSPEYKTHLKISPTEIFMTSLNGNKNKINATIGVKAYTEAVVGDVPAAGNSALPALKLTKNAPNNFNIILSADLPYTQAKELAKGQLLNKTFQFQGKKSVTITDFDIYGSDGKVIVKVDMIGSINGTIYLSGVPTYNATSQSITFENMDFDVNSKSALLKSANWLAHDKFVKIMQPYFTYSLAEQLKESKSMMQKAMTNNRVAKGVLLNGKLGDLAPREIILTQSSLKAIVDVKGTLGVTVDGLDQ